MKVFDIGVRVRLKQSADLLFSYGDLKIIVCYCAIVISYGETENINTWPEIRYPYARGPFAAHRCSSPVSLSPMIGYDLSIPILGSGLDSK